MNERAKAILDFWFIQSSMEDWFKKDDKYDEKIKKLFLEDLKKASNNEYDEWQDTAKECVALVILLDQFSRNLYRDSSAAFAQDYKTRLIVNEAVDRGYLEELEQNKIHFLLMPLIHSEDISDHIFGHKLIDTYLKSFEHFDKIFSNILSNLLFQRTVFIPDKLVHSFLVNLFPSQIEINSLVSFMNKISLYFSS